MDRAHAELDGETGETDSPIRGSGKYESVNTLDTMTTYFYMVLVVVVLLDYTSGLHYRDVCSH